MVETLSPDIIILDLGLPDMSGFQVLQSIRQFTDIPVVILTVSSEEVKVVKGLEMGANDYLTKPFRQMELLARLEAASRSLYHPNVSDICQKVGVYNFFPSRHEVEYRGKTIHLTHTESTILAHLLRNQNKSVTYSSIAHVLWSHEYDGAPDAIRVYLGNLRKKLEVDPTCPKLINTIPGVGYSLNISNN
jgi:two-component system KDP operon response regulator KdpE